MENIHSQVHDSLVFLMLTKPWLKIIHKKTTTIKMSNLNLFAVQMFTTSQNTADKDFGSYFIDGVFHNASFKLCAIYFQKGSS